MLEALVAAAAELLIAAELPVEDPVAGLSAPGLVVVSPDGHGVGTAVEEPLDAVGQLLTVGVFGGDVVGGVGLFVVVGDDGAHELVGLAATAAAGHVHTGGGLSVLVVTFPGEPLRRRSEKSNS